MTRLSRVKAAWREKAAQVGSALGVARWHSAVRAWLKTNRVRGPWCVALSGGADSLALLLALWANFPARRERLVALHFNHRLRGRAAEADEEFCRKVCAALGVKFVASRWKTVGRASRPTVGHSAVAKAMADRKARPTISEAEARAARHEYFSREMRRLRAKALWLAHQQDDIAETMLMRLARGSGAAGLAAPRPVQTQADGRVHLRPFLTLKKAEIVAALRAAGAVWRDDATNAGDDYFRNRVRKSVLPAWARAAGRDAVAGAALSRERLEEDDVALEAWTDRVARLDRRRLGLAALAGAPRAVTRRALHRWLLAQPHGSDLSRPGFEILLDLVEAGKATRFSLGRHGFAVIRRGWLVFQKTA
jgi:tRNA(Ile)-lysidine synthase